MNRLQKADEVGMRCKLTQLLKRTHPAVVKRAYTVGFRSSCVGWINTSPRRTICKFSISAYIKAAAIKMQ